MRAHIMIAVLTALAIFAVAHTASTQDRVIGAPECTADCSDHEADNGIGTTLPIDPNDYEDDDNNSDQ